VALADNLASASNVWTAVLALISDVGQAEVRMPATVRKRNIALPYNGHSQGLATVGSGPY
jgi:hypothetical protein